MATGVRVRVRVHGMPWMMPSKDLPHVVHDVVKNDNNVQDTFGFVSPFFSLLVWFDFSLVRKQCMCCLPSYPLRRHDLVLSAPLTTAVHRTST